MTDRTDMRLTSQNFASDLPSMESMGFTTKLKRSFPYHPGIDILRVHYEEEWTYYQWWAINKRIPDFDVIEKRWWRTKFMNWYRIHVRKSGIHGEGMVDAENVFFAKHPDLRHSWQIYRAKVILLESRKDRFGVTQHDFHYYLQRKWVILKKYEFMVRELGLREEPYWRQWTRGLVIDRYQIALVWCKHWNCWKVRCKYFPINIYWFFKWHFVYSRHKEYLDIH